MRTDPSAGATRIHLNRLTHATRSFATHADSCDIVRRNGVESVLVMRTHLRRVVGGAFLVPYVVILPAASACALPICCFAVNGTRCSRRLLPPLGDIVPSRSRHAKVPVIIMSRWIAPSQRGSGIAA